MKSRFIILLMAALIVAAPAETSARKKKAKEEDSKETVRTPYEKLFKDRKGECAEGMFTVRKTEGKIYFEIPVTKTPGHTTGICSTR